MRLEQKPLRIALVAMGDPEDARVWSGTAWHIRDILERRGELVHVVHRPWPPLRRTAGRVLKRLSAGRWSHERSTAFMDWAARPLLQELARQEFDVVFAVSTPFAAPLAARYPTVVITDATARGIYGYYPDAPGIGSAAARQAIASDRTTLDRALLWSVPSAWAARSLMTDFAAPPGKIAEIPFGANLVVSPAVRPKRWSRGQPLQVLFAGVDWHRKGGEIALAAVEMLRAAGMDARLDIVGVDQARIGRRLPSHAAVHGFIDKNTAEGRARIDALFAAAQLFLLPSMAEAYGLVFAEAAHHGLPSVGFATGGVTSVVRSGETGLLLDAGSRPADFAGAIGRLLADEAAYAAMSQAALDDAHDRLNWAVWAERMAAATRTALGRQAGAP